MSHLRRNILVATGASRAVAMHRPPLPSRAAVTKHSRATIELCLRRATTRASPPASCRPRSSLPSCCRSHAATNVAALSCSENLEPPHGCCSSSSSRRQPVMPPPRLATVVCCRRRRSPPELPPPPSFAYTKVTVDYF